MIFAIVKNRAAFWKSETSIRAADIRFVCAEANVFFFLSSHNLVDSSNFYIHDFWREMYDHLKLIAIDRFSLLLLNSIADLTLDILPELQEI
jgi:hypothetical protein